MNNSQILHICPRCGELIRGKEECPRCRCLNVIPTEYNTSIVEHMVFEEKPSTYEKFKHDLREKYTVNSNLFDKQKYQELLNFEQKQKDEHMVMTDEDYDIEQEKIKQYQNKKSVNQNIPRCPTCRSTNIRKISVTERATSIGLFGIFSKKINKTFKCNNCGYKW